MSSAAPACPEPVAHRPTSCGVIVGDGHRILLGHATRSPRWDIPKGVAEPDEAFADAAIRELREETGLSASVGSLVALGVHRYLRNKDLALFAWHLETLPDPQSLSCASTFVAADGAVLPEFDRFALVPWREALGRVGKSLARVLATIPLAASYGASR